MNLSSQIELYLLERADWVPVKDICIKFGVDQRALRATGKTPGLCDTFAISSNAGYKHASLINSQEYLSHKHRLRKHAIQELRKARRWDQARKNCLYGMKPSQIERHSGQILLPL